jgi:YHS domain-containing protein
VLRLILYLVAFYFFFKLLKRLFGAKGPQAEKASKPTFTEAPRQINEMVQDPVCKVYVPKKEALSLEHEGARHYFCCRSCLEKFQKKDDML